LCDASNANNINGADGFNVIELDAPEELEKIIRQIRHKLVDLLSRREHSHAELVQKLIQRGYQKSDIIPVLDELVKKDWQSDQRFAQAYVRYRSSRGFGPDRITQELREKGINGELIARFVVSDPSLDPSLDPGIDWCEIAKEVYLKRFGDNNPLSFEELVKRKKYLLYRGFNHEQIKQVMST